MADKYEELLFKYDEVLFDLKVALNHLQTVSDHADEDCPSRDRSKWFNSSIQDAFKFIDDTASKWKINHGYINKE